MTDKQATPRTDAEDRWQVDPDDLGQPTRDTVRIEFARELERENAGLRAALVELVDANTVTRPIIPYSHQTRWHKAIVAARALVEAE